MSENLLEVEKITNDPTINDAPEKLDHLHTPKYYAEALLGKGLLSQEGYMGEGYINKEVNGIKRTYINSNALNTTLVGEAAIKQQRQLLINLVRSAYGMEYLETINMSKEEETKEIDSLMRGWQNDGGKMFTILSSILGKPTGWHNSNGNGDIFNKGILYIALPHPGGGGVLVLNAYEGGFGCDWYYDNGRSFVRPAFSQDS